MPRADREQMWEHDGFVGPVADVGGEDVFDSGTRENYAHSLDTPVIVHD